MTDQIEAPPPSPPQQSPSPSQQPAADKLEDPRKRPKLPIECIQDGTKDHSTKIECVCEFLDNMVSGEACYPASFYGNYRGKCTCLSGHFKVEATKQRVADYLVRFHQESKEQQTATVFSWIQYATLLQEATKSNSLKFLLPQHGKVEPGRARLQICRTTLVLLLGMGFSKWKTLIEKAETNDVSKPHGLKGRSSNHGLRGELLDHLKAYFEEIKLVAISRLSEDQQNEELEVPFSMRNLYVRYCERNGHNLIFDPQNRTTREQMREDAVDCCSWATFKFFWKTNYPELIIRRFCNSSASS